MMYNICETGVLEIGSIKLGNAAQEKAKEQ